MSSPTVFQRLERIRADLGAVREAARMLCEEYAVLPGIESEDRDLMRQMANADVLLGQADDLFTPTVRTHVDRDMSSSLDVLPSRDVIEQRLEAQRSALWDARAIVDMAAAALEERFGQAWPGNLPEYPRALRIAGNTIDQTAGMLEPDVLLDPKQKQGEGAQL